MSKETEGIFEHQIKNENGQVIECRKYYTPQGLAERLPGRKRNGHMNICTVYELFKKGMPGVIKIAGKRLLPIDSLPKVMDWLEKRSQNI